MNKIPDVCKKKQIVAIKYQRLRGKCFTTSDYNKFTSDILDAKIKEKGLVGEYLLIF